MSLWRARTHEIRSRYIGRVVNHHCLPIPPMRSEIEAKRAARQNRPDPIRPADVTRHGSIRAWRAE